MPVKIDSDTIAAVSTAWGEGGIAIVRVSGNDSLKIAGRILKNKIFDSPGKMKLTSLLDKEKNVIDQVLAVYFQKPRSYTGEDIVEIHTHGGVLIAKLCLELLINNGARIAEPGEFTKRAFLNGRIDLSQAEGVLGIIKSRSIESLYASARTLTGELSENAKKIYHDILILQGNLEISLDFPEGEKADFDLNSDLLKIKSELEDLESRCSAGFLLNNGVKIVIAGRPNVGKSSLMNALLKKRRAIVTDIPGTTRDIIEENLNINGIPVKLIDTAGLRDSDDKIEITGIELAKEALKESDVCLWVIDSSCEFNPEDLNFIKEFEKNNIILAFNKSDLPIVTKDINFDAPKIFLSAKNGDGIDDLKKEIFSIASGGAMLNSGLNASQRQIEEIRDCLNLISQAIDSEKLNYGEDVIAGNLNSARHSLMKVLGIEANNNEELLDSVFSRFCVGK